METFKLIRAHDIQMRPDSVRVRHILLSNQAFDGDRQLINKLADSWLTN